MIARARARLAREEGISIVVAICTMALLIVLAGTALEQGVQALYNSTDHANRKRALQAADAAIDVAIFRLNRADLGGSLKIDVLNPTSVTNQVCVASVGDPAALDLVPLPTGTAADPRGRRWCPETAAESTGNGASFVYRVSELARVAIGDCGGQGSLSLDREVVAIGTSGDQTRRVKTKLRASISLLSGAAVQSGSSTAPMRMSGTARVLGDVQSNHNIIGVATNVISGRATPGPGNPTGTPPVPAYTVSGVTPVGSNAAACQPLVLPPVDQGDARTVNDNPPLASGFPNRCLSAGLLSVGCSLPLLGTTGGVEWSPGNKTLRVYGNGYVSLPDDTYSFCSLRLEGQAILVIPPTSSVTRIFMDDPANCSGVSSAGQVTMDGTARIVNCHLQTQPQTLQLYAVGNATTATTQTFAGASSLSATALATLCGVNLPVVGTPMVIYAPRSRVLLGGSAAFSGQVAGDTVEMSGAAAVEPVNALINLNQLGANPVLPLYQTEDYVECVGGRATFSALPPADPAQGC